MRAGATPVPEGRVFRRPPLPRRRSQRLGYALGALAAASAPLWLASAGIAQTYSDSPLTPALTDPRHRQRFGRPPEPPRRLGAQAEPAEPIPSGAGDTGFEAASGQPGKKKAARSKPGAAHPPAPPPPPPPGPPQQHGGHTTAPQVAARAAYAEAYRPPDAQRRRPPPSGDPFEPLGLRVGSFMLRPAIEISRGFDTNPVRVRNGSGSAFTVVAPELQLRSQWTRHEFGANLRGSYTDYDSASQINRPLFDGKTFTRFDLSRDTSINSESRLYLATDNPGSPNLRADLARLPIYYSYGSTVGLTQRFNRLEIALSGSMDSTRYEDSTLTDGTTASNRDRNYDQYGGKLRASYEVMPGVKPFAEIGADTRRHEQPIDNNGFARDSRALTPRVGSTFELARRLTGEVSVGYQTRSYRDPALADLRGVVADASLVWTVSGLTTATLTATSRAEESTLPGVSGALRRDVGVQIDHAFRRWLIGTLKFGYGQDDYVGLGRNDTRASLGAALLYKVNREVGVKGEYRYEWLASNVPGVDYDANIFLLGLKFQR